MLFLNTSLNLTKFRLLSAYNPYINYSWSQTLTVGGSQQIKDTGTARLNLQQFFGQGCWFNGIDMQITIPVNATIQTEIKRVNGVVEINTNTQNLTNYNVYSGSGAKVYKDLYMFNRALTPTEIEKYNNQPNQFFMDSLEDSSCVLAMPMCEKDNFVRNYKSYSEGNNLVVDSNFENQNLWVIGDSSTTNISGSALNFTNTTSFVYPNPFLSIFNTPNTINKWFMVEVEVINYQSGSVRVEIGASVSGNNATPYITANGKYIFIVQHITNNTNRPIIRFISFTGSVTNFRIKEITSIYPITNYLTTCRTNAQRLTYGLQTSGFKRDSLGRILSKSNFLEADGVGYGDTGYISPLVVVPESFEIIIEKPKVLQSSFTKYVCGGASSADIVVEVNSGSDTNGYVRLRKAGRGFNSAQWLPTNKMLITLVCDGTNVYVYFNGVSSGTYVAQPYTVSNPIKLMAEHGINNSIAEGKLMNQSSLRLFKVHQKALTQEEVTKNFNKYQSQGLLNA